MITKINKILGTLAQGLIVRNNKRLKRIVALGRGDGRIPTNGS